MRIPLTIAAAGACALLATACTADPAEPEATDGPLITLEAITIEPSPADAGDGAFASDDDYCALMMEALVLTRDAGLVIDETLASITPELIMGGGDLGPINDAGSTVNTYGVESRELYDRAILLVEEPEIIIGFDKMIEFIEVYTLPVALVMVAASDFEAMATDLGAIATSPEVQSSIATASTHQEAVESYTEERCGVEIDVFTR